LLAAASLRRDRFAAGLFGAFAFDFFGSASRFFSASRFRRFFRFFFLSFFFL
jgi:hypothetical protein